MKRTLAVLALTALLAACGASSTPDTTVTTTTTTQTTMPGGVELTIDTITPSVSVVAPSEWQVDPEWAPGNGGFMTPMLQWLAFSVEGPEGVDDWLAEIQSLNLVLTEPQPTEVGGAAGVVFDARVGEDPQVEERCHEPCVALLTDWALVGDYPNRIWLVDVDGRSVLIVTDSDEMAFERWTEEVEQVLATLTWG